MVHITHHLKYSDLWSNEYTNVHFHIRNHYINTWTRISITKRRCSSSQRNFASCNLNSKKPDGHRMSYNIVLFPEFTFFLRIWDSIFIFNWVFIILHSRLYVNNKKLSIFIKVIIDTFLIWQQLIKQVYLCQQSLILVWCSWNSSTGTDKR